MQARFIQKWSGPPSGAQSLHARSSCGSLHVRSLCKRVYAGVHAEVCMQRFACRSLHAEVCMRDFAVARPQSLLNQLLNKITQTPWATPPACTTSCMQTSEGRSPSELLHKLLHANFRMQISCMNSLHAEPVPKPGGFPTPPLRRPRAFRDRGA